jgi:hypothetical protein
MAERKNTPKPLRVYLDAQGLVLTSKEREHVVKNGKEK